MKKWFLTLAMVLMLAASAFAGEKVMKDAESGVAVSVPETAPEFFGWQGQIMGQKSFENGQTLLMAQFINEDGSVVVNSLWLMTKDDVLHLVALAVFYNEPATMDVMEDLPFLETGVPSDRLVPVEEFHNGEAFLNAAGKMGI